MSSNTLLRLSDGCLKVWQKLRLSPYRKRWGFGRQAAINRTFASVSNSSTHLQPGDELHGFVVKRRKSVPELQLTAVHLYHHSTGAEHLHVARDDKNNVFSIGFKTNPPDATGVPHILEHTTLCGSDKLVPNFTYARSILTRPDIPCEIPSSKCFHGRCQIL